jgi:hypothetical protein
MDDLDGRTELPEMLRDRSHHDHAANGDGTDLSDRACPVHALALRQIHCVDHRAA